MRSLNIQRFVSLFSRALVVACRFVHVAARFAKTKSSSSRAVRGAAALNAGGRPGWNAVGRRGLRRLCDDRARTSRAISCREPSCHAACGGSFARSAAPGESMALFARRPIVKPPRPAAVSRSALPPAVALGAATGAGDPRSVRLSVGLLSRWPAGRLRRLRPLAGRARPFPSRRLPPASRAPAQGITRLGCLVGVAWRGRIRSDFARPRRATWRKAAAAHGQSLDCDGRAVSPAGEPLGRLRLWFENFRERSKS